jgi:small subunit ribosomal protein S3Ae
MAAKKKKSSEKQKQKEWYKVLAPEKYDSKELGEVLAADEKMLLNRVIPVSLGDLTGKFSQSGIYTTLNFRIKEIKGKTAQTELIGHSLSPSYLRTFIRRRRAVLHSVLDISTKDEKEVRLKLVAVTREKISEVQKGNLRRAIEDEVVSASESFPYYELMDEIMYGRLATRIFNKAKEVTPMDRIEFRKSELKETFE